MRRNKPPELMRMSTVKSIDSNRHNGMRGQNIMDSGIGEAIPTRFDPKEGMSLRSQDPFFALAKTSSFSAGAGLMNMMSSMEVVDQTETQQ